MQFLATLSALALAASAYRCKIDRISGPNPQLCADSNKVGDQTESDGCSKKHSSSCYKVHHDTPGDANCHLYVTAGGGCDAEDQVYAKVQCTPGQYYFEPREASYVVRCDT